MPTPDKMKAALERVQRMRDGETSVQVYRPSPGLTADDEVLVDTITIVNDYPRLLAERDKLQAFKVFVHGYLDTHGVPHHPPGPHGAEGCRIGDRMDWLMAQDAALRDVARAYEQWEADLILCQEAWRGGRAEFPTITAELWDRLLAIQGQRNAALGEQP